MGRKAVRVPPQTLLSEGSYAAVLHALSDEQCRKDAEP